MKKTILMSATGLVAGALFFASPLVTSANAADMVQLAQTTTNSMNPAGPLPDTTLARPEYENQMQSYIDQQNRSIDELRTGTSNLTEDQLNDMTSSWQDIQNQWDESRGAAEGDWPTYRDSLNQSLTTFNDRYGSSLGAGNSGAATSAPSLGGEAGGLGNDTGGATTQ
jgi:hypothetical protein